MPRVYSEWYLRKKETKEWRTRKHGNRKQIGKKFPITKKPRRRIKVASIVDQQSKKRQTDKVKEKRLLAKIEKICASKGVVYTKDLDLKEDVRGHVVGGKDLEALSSLLRKGDVYSPREGMYKSTEPGKKKTFPKTVGNYTLKKTVKNDYAWYEHDVGFGFAHGLEVAKVHPENQPEKSLVRIRSLSNTASMTGKPTRWIVTREDYFYNMDDAIGHLKGETRVYKPKRKPEVIRPLTEKQIKTYWE